VLRPFRKWKRVAPGVVRRKQAAVIGRLRLEEEESRTGPVWE
jgi:hypothetical protein